MKAIILLRDEYGNKIVGKEFEGSYTLSGGSEVSYCLKRGTVQNIKAVYSRTCLDSEYQKNLSFDYHDTIG